MTELSWKKEEIQEAFSDCRSLREIIDKVTEERTAHKELVCDIRVNGEFLSEEKERELSGLLPNELSSLEIVSQTESELLLNSLESQGELIESLRIQVIKSYTSFRTQGIDQAHQDFCNVLEGCQFLAEALGLLKQSLTAHPGFDLTETDWKPAESKFEASIREMLAAYEEKDYHLAADVLEYELGESLDLWRQTLNHCLMILE